MSAEMKKLLETIDSLMREPVGEATGSVEDELADDIETIYHDLLEQVSMLDQLFRQIPNRNTQERARRQVLSHLQMALNDEHMWIGNNMMTLEKLIQELRSQNDEEGDEYE